MAQSTAHCRAQGPALKAQAQPLQLERAKLRRRFGRQCRGQGKVFVSLVRQTEPQLLTTGAPVVTLAPTAQAQIQSAAALTAEQRERWDTTLTGTLATHQQLVHPIAAPHPRQAPDPR